jgi:hypothetical protein
MKKLNEGAVKDLLLRGPDKNELYSWAYETIIYGSGDPIEEIKEYLELYELSSSELQTLASIYMEDADEDEMEVFSDLVTQIVEAKNNGELNESYANEKPAFKARFIRNS